MPNLDYFTFLVIVNGLVIFSCIFTSYRKFKDPFHPVIYLGFLLASIYFVLPTQLAFLKPETLVLYLSVPQLEYLQTLYIFGSLALLMGCLYASGFYSWNVYLPSFSFNLNRRIRKLAWIIGLFSIVIFLYNIFRVGGFIAAYGRSYGGGWSDIGYLREVFLFSLPATILYLISFNQEPLRLRNWVSIFSLISPLVIQGLLGGRRGPTAMALIALGMTWFLLRRRRPSLLLVIISSVTLGLILLFLVANRGELYIGSSFEFRFDNLFSYFGLNEGSTSLNNNEYVYGGGAILNADLTSFYYWGRRYFVIMFIRPIPRFFWQNKYADTADWLDIPNIEFGNLGVGEESLRATLGWIAARGAAPALFADLWIEFSWLSIGVLFFIGWFYGWAWRKMVSQSGFWTIHFIIISALSVYLISQTLEAMLFRYLLLTGGLLVSWRWLVGHQLSPSLPQSPKRNLPASPLS